jgi:hypothetical protein
MVFLFTGVLDAVDPLEEARKLSFLQWRLAHDHNIRAADIAAAFDLPEGDALAMLRGDMAIPDRLFEACRRAVKSWKRDLFAGDVRQFIRREAAALSAIPISQESF